MKKEEYKCPFCESHISKERYEMVIKENRLLKDKISQLEDDNKKHIERFEINKKKLDEREKRVEKRNILEKR